MKFNLTSTFRHTAGAALAAAALLLPQGASADLLMSEDFSTCSAGNLYQQNDWMRHTTASPVHDDIQVVNVGLSYPGYQTTATAKSASFTKGDNTAPQEKLKKQFRDKTDSTDPVYYAFIVNLSEVPTNQKASYFFSFITANSSETGLTDMKGGNEFGRVFAYQSDVDGKFKFGFSKNGNTMQNRSNTDPDYDLNSDVLVVCKWEYVDDSSNDVYKYWINPAKSDVEPETVTNSVNSGADPILPKTSLQGVQIRQGLSSSKITPTGKISAIRVATTWAELWEGGEGPVVPVVRPAINASVSKVDFDWTMQGLPAQTRTVHINAENLTEDITVQGLTAIIPSATTISKEDAMSEAGYDLTLTLTTDNAGIFNETLQLVSGEATRSIPVSGSVQEVLPRTTISQLNNLDEADYNIYRYTGEAIVTFIDTNNDIIYAQDATGGVKIVLDMFYGDNNLTRGDKITDIFCSYADVFGGHGIMPVNTTIATVVSQGNEVEPIEVTLADLSSQKVEYLSRVVKVSDITFTGWNEDLKFSSSATPIASGEATGSVRSFAGTDIAGTAVPQTAASVTGISTSTGAVVISMRSLSDLEQSPANLELTSVEKVIDNEWKAVGGEYPHTVFTVKTTNLKSPVSIWLGGKDRSNFTVDKEEIPAGSATTTVTVTYKPTTTGVHSAMINFDASPAELSQSLSLGARAWDPANPPVITVDTAELTPFSAKAGEQQEQTIRYTAANLLDYGNVKVVQEEGGAFRINSTTLMKEGTYDIKVTFVPTAVGDYTATLEFTAEKAEPVYVSLSGKTETAPEPEPVEGDELAYDTTNPLALLEEDFSDCGEHNKPLSLEGWKNVAEEGTRAWWAYTFDDNNTAAKVTPYDSKAEEGTPCRMMLLSPALNFKDAAAKMLSFRIMGQYLSEGQTDLLEVCYIDPAGDTPWIEPIQGLDIPAIADLNNEWVAYNVDLTGQNIADTFFIGFRLTSPRGTDNVATYYVDDFSWGKSTVGIDGIDTDDEAAPADVYTIGGALVARGLIRAEAQRTLAPGLYIHGTSKLVIR